MRAGRYAFSVTAVVRQQCAGRGVPPSPIYTNVEDAPAPLPGVVVC